MKKLAGEIITFKLEPNKFGENTASLYCHPFQGKSTKAVLYLHGFNDYFFQEHMADWYTGIGFQFFALDLRRYGRSLLPHQKPNTTHNLVEYDEEILLSLAHINKSFCTKVVLLGHSTGGLIASLFCHRHRDQPPVKALILNSPFLDFNMSVFEKAVLPLIAFTGRLFPYLPSPAGLKKGYGESVHKTHHGEWDFDLKIKPVLGYPVDLGWVNAIYTAQKKLQNGLDIPIPVLVMHSDKSVPPGDFKQEMLYADSVLNVKDIARYAKKMGKHVTTKVINNGMHDLTLSQRSARDEAFKVMKEFLDQID